MKRSIKHLPDTTRPKFDTPFLDSLPIAIQEAIWAEVPDDQKLISNGVRVIKKEALGPLFDAVAKHAPSAAWKLEAERVAVSIKLATASAAQTFNPNLN